MEKNKNYTDGSLCYQICHAVSTGINTGREIYSVIGYTSSYDNFRSALSKIKKRGYICFSSHQKIKNPFKEKRSYQLTAKGQRFLQNPHERWERKQAKYNAAVIRILKTQPEFLTKLAKEEASLPTQKKIEYVNNALGTDFTTHDIGHVEELIKSMKGNNETSNNDINYKSKYLTLAEKYNNLMVAYQNIKNDGANSNKQFMKNTPKQDTPLQKHRKKIAKQCYEGRLHLNYNFFKSWGTIPVKLKGSKFFTRSTVEFISKSNKEFDRNHVTILPPDKIYESGFYIAKIDEKGITIVGRGCEQGQHLTY